MIESDDLSRKQKAKIDEAAILFRLCIHGFSVFCSPFDGDTEDWVVKTGSGFKKIQVKWVREQRHGMPSVSLVKTAGHNKQTRYSDEDFDFIIGYDFFSDIAYVYSKADVSSNRRMISVNKDCAEKWVKLRE